MRIHLAKSLEIFILFGIIYLACLRLFEISILKKRDHKGTHLYL